MPEVETRDPSQHELLSSEVEDLMLIIDDRLGLEWVGIAIESVLI